MGTVGTGTHGAIWKEAPDAGPDDPAAGCGSVAAHHVHGSATSVVDGTGADQEAAARSGDWCRPAFVRLQLRPVHLLTAKCPTLLRNGV